MYLTCVVGMTSMTNSKDTPPTRDLRSGLRHLCDWVGICLSPLSNQQLKLPNLTIYAKCLHSLRFSPNMPEDMTIGKFRGTVKLNHSKVDVYPSVQPYEKLSRMKFMDIASLDTIKRLGGDLEQFL